MIIKNVIDKDHLDSLYSQSALTWEGLSEDKENLSQVEEWLINNGSIKEKIEFHVIKGNVINNIYCLTENNAYPSDTTLISVTGINTAKIILKRFEVGGRWFDDIVDNNLIRE